MTKFGKLKLLILSVPYYFRVWRSAKLMKFGAGKRAVVWRYLEECVECGGRRANVCEILACYNRPPIYSGYTNCSCCGVERFFSYPGLARVGPMAIKWPKRNGETVVLWANDRREIGDVTHRGEQIKAYLERIGMHDRAG